MAKLPSSLARSVTSYFGVLELVGFLAQHPKDDYVYGEGEGAITLSNHEARAIIDDFQRDNLPTPDQVKLESADSKAFSILYDHLLKLGAEKQTSIPDQETREAALRAFREHKQALDLASTPKTDVRTIGGSVRSAQAYWAKQALLADSITRALSPVFETDSVAGTYAKQMQNNLIAEITPLLENIDTTDPVKAKDATRAIVEHAINSSSSQAWKQLENELVSEGKSFETVKSSLTNLLNQEKFVASVTKDNITKLQNLKQAHGLTPSEAKVELQQTLNAWQQNSGVGRNSPNQLGDDLVQALHRSVIETVTTPSILDRFGAQEDLATKALRRALSDEVLAKYDLTSVDRDRLIETTLHSPATTTYINRLTNGLEAPRGDIADVVGLRPTNLVAYISKNAGIDPYLVSLTRSGLSGDQLAGQLIQAGYSRSEITSQLNQLQSYLSNNQGLVGTLYKTRLRYDQTLVKIRTALSPTNIPLIRNIYSAYYSARESISAAYNGFLNNHKVIAFLISPDHRFMAWAGWINKLAISPNLPNWLRSGLTFYKNGGYSVDGYFGALKAHYRIKLGKWLIDQGAKAGGEKLFGKFLAWAGASLVAGTASGGVGFAIQAGLWLAQQAGKAPDIIKNADVIAGWALKNLAGLAVLAGMFGNVAIGALLGFTAGIISLFFISWTWPALVIVGVFTGIGMLAGYLWSQAGGIGVWASSGLATIGAGLKAWFAGLGEGLGSVTASTGVLVTGTILFTTISMWFGMDTVVTSKIESAVGPDELISIFEEFECTTENPPVGLAPVNNNITQASYEIMSNLYQGFWCYWNRPANPAKSQQYISFFQTVDTITYPESIYPKFFERKYFNYEQFFADQHPPVGGQELFWCTRLVEEAYTKAGNPFIPRQLRSDLMQAEFADLNKFIPANQASSNNIQPGATIFFYVKSGENRTNHVGVVNSVSSGGITYYQSNAGTKTGSLAFINGNAVLDNIGDAIITVGIGNP